MKMWLMYCLGLCLSAYSARRSVRCDSRLQPINPPGVRAAPGAADRPVQKALMISAPATQEYFREAESWDADRAAQLRRSERVAWWVAGAGWLCAVAGAFALVLLMPLKRVDPFVVRVDSSTGVVDVVPVFAGRATQEEAVTRYFLTHYLTVCERFNFATAESDYEECGAFHSAQRNQAWYALWTATNPLSPLNVHKDGSRVRVQVISVSFFTRASGLSDLAQVRYLKALRQGPAPRNPSRIGLRPFSTRTGNRRRIRRRGAGIRSASRSLISVQNPKCWASRPFSRTPGTWRRDEYRDAMHGALLRTGNGA